MNVELEDGVSEIFAESVAGVLSSGFTAVLDAFFVKAREVTPVKTGSLLESITLSNDGPLVGLISFSSPYASYLEEGTGLYGPWATPYLIRPVRKRALYWPGAGHPVGGVSAKGIRPLGFTARMAGETDISGAFHGAGGPVDSREGG